MKVYFDIAAIVVIPLFLVAGLIMVSRPRRIQGTNDRLVGIFMLAFVAFIARPVTLAVLHGQPVHQPSSGESTPLVARSAITTDILGIALITEGILSLLWPQILQGWLRRIHSYNHPDQALQGSELRRTGRATSLLFILGGAAFLAFAYVAVHRVPFPTDLFVLVIGLFVTAFGIYEMICPAEDLALYSYPWSHVPRWGHRIMGAGFFAAGIALLRMYVMQIPLG